MPTRIPFVLRQDDGTLAPGVDLSAGGVVQVSLDQGGTWQNRAGAAPTGTGSGAYYYQLDPAEVVPPWVLLKIEIATYQTVIQREFIAGGSLTRIPFVLRADDGTLTAGVDLSGAGVVQVSIDQGATWTNRVGAAPHSTGSGAYYYALDVTEQVLPWVLLKVALATYQTVIQREDRAIGGVLTAPTITNRTPAVSTNPGAPGGFSSVFRVARETPIECDISGVATGAAIVVTVRYENRLETYVALGVDGAFTWPFDLAPDNSIGDLTAPPAHLKLFPRGGWPPCNVEVLIGAVKEATG